MFALLRRTLRLTVLIALGIAPNAPNLATLNLARVTVPAQASRLQAALITDVREFGADPLGTLDSTLPMQNCLNSVGAGGTCSAAGGRYKILGKLTIPRQTTLSCGSAFFDSEDGDNRANFGTLPALMLDRGQTISAGGQSASVTNCLIYRDGMTFPAVDSSAYAGIALSDAGNSNFAVTNSVILGFDTAISITGSRPYLRRVYMDATGIVKAALQVANGNSDSGYFDEIKIQPIATGNYGDTASCSASRRGGTGFRMTGQNFIGTAIVQNFVGAQFDFGAQVNANILWPDDLVQCAGRSSIGLLINRNGSILVHEVNANGTDTGIKFVNGSGAAYSQIGAAFFNQIGHDCVQLGATGVSGGSVVFRSIALNQGGQSPNCGRYVVNYLDDGNNSYLFLGDGPLMNSGGSTPYINVARSVPYNRINVSDTIVTDLAASNSLYGAPSVGACTGLGIGSCTLVSSIRTTPWTGLIQLSPAGSPSSSGVVRMIFPLTKANAFNCRVAPASGSANWPTPVAVQMTSVDGTHEDINWSTNAILTAGQTYLLDYDCKPI
jgi:hypothetical protein